MKRVILTGKACCGKTHLKERFISNGYTPSISYTTRPMRDNELDGRDYNFISKDEFKNMIEEGKFLEWEYFKKEYYGTPIDTDGTILIMSTDGIKQIPKEIRSQHLVIFLDIPREILIERMMKRGWSESEIRERFDEDDIKFDGFVDYDLRITNSDF
jgi:guanylate kinase